MVCARIMLIVVLHTILLCTHGSTHGSWLVLRQSRFGGEIPLQTTRQHEFRCRNHIGARLVFLFSLLSIGKGGFGAPGRGKSCPPAKADTCLKAGKLIKNKHAFFKIRNRQNAPRAKHIIALFGYGIISFMTRENKKIELPKGTILPNHIAVICDGNGGWARSRGLPVAHGHEAGAKALKDLVRNCRNLGIHTLTVWGFSTENWNRPKKEVMHIMNLVKKTILETLDEAKRDGVRFIHLGRKDRLPHDILNLITKAEEETKNNTKYVFIIISSLHKHFEIKESNIMEKYNKLVNSL